mmetsp:Transcript_10921/g.16101  ORF Transcript_10921/g.16101 Transcript_10921/m.16101 type:complete len:307 (-) Transcript_10921:44-964(-)
MSTAANAVCEGDFKDRQFSEAEVSRKVVEQYDGKQARVFYKYVMGGGGMDIHYGCFRSEKDSVFEASKATNDRLMCCLDWAFPMSKTSYVLDLGSGHGGLSHEIAKRFGCKVMGINISPEQNKMNMDEANKEGVGELVDVTLGDINSGLPTEWTNTFTHVVSCEVLCHAADKSALFKELKRVLKPGGAFVFTDIMGADGADEVALKAFTDRNATSKMARPSEYLQLLEDNDFKHCSYLDFSQHLLCYYRSMLNQIKKNYDAMVSEGCSEEYLAKWTDTLEDRVEMQREKSVFAWGFFSSRIDGPLY